MGVVGNDECGSVLGHEEDMANCNLQTRYSSVVVKFECNGHGHLIS